MAFPVINEKYLDEFPKKEVKEKVKDVVTVAASKVESGMASAFDYLLVLTVAFWYYFFTGFSILIGRNVPDQWLRLGTRLGMSKVSARINKTIPGASGEESGTKNAPKRVFKVVDIDTKRPMKVNKTSK